MDKSTSEQEAILLIRQHKGMLIRICNTWCRQEADREDLFQEIVYQVLKSYHRYDAQYRFSTWLYRVALNVSISFFRKESRTPESNIETPEDIADVPGEEKEEHLQLLEKWIAELNPLDKSLMILYLDKRSHDEIARILGISVSNVGTRIGRVKEKLRTKFSNHTS